MKNIILIGMPGAGKSTIGVLLAKSMLFSFTDTDLTIQSKYGMSLCEIIEREGTDGFLKIEDETIAECNFANSVVATGGSAVYGENAMAKLKAEGTVIYLKLPLTELKKRLGDIRTRGVAMPKGAGLSELYEERSPLYEKYADIPLECEGLTAAQCVDRIVELIKEK